MSESNPTATDRATVWHEHVASWKASGLTQKAYAQEQGLRRSAFGYWVRKLRRESGDQVSGSAGFVPVAFAPSRAGLTLALPNGLEIRGIETHHLGVLRQILELLA